MYVKVQTQELHITKNKVIQGRQIRIFVTKMKTLVFQRTSHDMSQHSTPRQQFRGTGSQTKVQCQFIDKFGHHEKYGYRARGYLRELLSQNSQVHNTNVN